MRFWRTWVCNGVTYLILFFLCIIVGGLYLATRWFNIDFRLPSNSELIQQSIQAGAKKGLWENAIDFVALEPFAIDLAASESACPGFNTRAYKQWRNSLELYGRKHTNGTVYFGRVVRIHLLEDGYHIFIIDRAARACVEDKVLSLELDKYKVFTEANSYTIIRAPMDWIQIKETENWRYVPPQ